MPDPRFEAETPFSDADIQAIEDAIGRELPKGYCDFVKEYGGIFVGGLVDGSEELPIDAFIDAREDHGILSNLALYPDLKEENILPFAFDVLGNIYVFDRDNTVHFIDYYGGETTACKVSDTFDDFLSRIVVTKE